MLPLPPGPFSVVYADPPWEYSDRLRHRGASGTIRGAASHYQTMALADILVLPVAEIAAPNAALFLWATGPMMQEALDTVAFWGFKFKTVAFTWTKTTKRGLPHFGMGRYTRSGSEFVLLGIRGRMPPLSRSVRQLVQAPIGVHSAKPPEVARRIEMLYGNVPRVELFARVRLPGWEAWGDELQG